MFESFLYVYWSHGHSCDHVTNMCLQWQSSSTSAPIHASGMLMLFDSLRTFTEKSSEPLQKAARLIEYRLYFIFYQ